MTKQAELKKQAYTSDLKSRALSILIYLIDRSNKDLTCFPAIPTMAEQLHISQSTVKRALKELVETGFIQKDSRFRENNRGQSSNLYTLVFKAEVPTPERDNNLNHDDYIEPAEQTSATSDRKAERITFSDIAAKQEQTAPVPQEIAPKAQKPIKAVPPRTKRPNIFCPCTPVHSAIFEKLHHTHFLATEKANAEQFLPCVSHFSQWTGAEVNLIPP